MHWRVKIIIRIETRELYSCRPSDELNAKFGEVTDQMLWETLFTVKR